MAFRDDVIKILSGGLPTLIETPAAPAPEPTRVEAIEPEPQLADREPFLMNVSRSQIFAITAGLVGLIAVVAVFRRL